MKSNNDLKIGFAKIDITPKKGIPLAGTCTLRPNDGVLHRIFARVMVLEQGGKRHVILGVDSLGIKPAIVDRLKEKTSRLKVVSILCNASHTHCAPDAYDGFYENMNDKALLKLRAVYQDFLEKKLFEVIEAACAKLKRGSLRFNNSEEAGFAVNRRRFYKGAWQLMPNFKTKIDKRVSVISAHHPSGALMGVVYSYTCHTTTYYSMNQVTGDFVSGSSQLIEAEAGVPTVFLQGPCGDIRPGMVNPEKPEFFGRTTPQALQRVATELGSAVLRSLRKKGKRLKPELEAITTHVHLPIQLEMSDERIEAYQKYGLEKNTTHTLEILGEYKAMWFEMMLKRSATERRKPFCMPMLGLRLSKDFMILALGHELGSRYAGLFQKLTKKTQILTLGYTNANEAYVMPAKEIREGGYEGDYSNYCCGLPAPFSEVTEVVIVDRAKEIIKRLA